MNLKPRHKEFALHEKEVLNHENGDMFLKEHIFNEDVVRQQGMENYDNTQDSSIKLSIKKKDLEKINSPTFYESIKNEFNERNILIFILLFIATLPQSNELIRKGLMSFANASGYSHMTITLIKCVLLLLVFILVKRFLFSS